MLYKYVFLMFLALKIGSVFGAEKLDEDGYENAYRAFELADKQEGQRLAKIKEGLSVSKTYNNCDDAEEGNTDKLVRSILAGLYLRKSVLKLDFSELRELVEANDEFFQTRLGVSLLYGWTLNRYNDVQTPYYVGKFFSFYDHFQGLVDNAGFDDSTKTFLSGRFTMGWKAVEDDRWAFYFDHMLWLHSAIDRVRTDNESNVKGIIVTDYSVIDGTTNSEGNSDPVFGGSSFFAPEGASELLDLDSISSPSEPMNPLIQSAPLKKDKPVDRTVPTNVLSSFRSIEKQKIEKVQYDVQLGGGVALASHLWEATAGSQKQEALSDIQLLLMDSNNDSKFEPVIRLKRILLALPIYAQSAYMPMIGSEEGAYDLYLDKDLTCVLEQLKKHTVVIAGGDLGTEGHNTVNNFLYREPLAKRI